MRDFRFDIWPVSKEFTILAILSSKNLSQRIWIKFLSCLSCYVFGMAQMGKKCNIKARGSIQFLFSVVVMYFSCFLNCQGPKDEKIWITKSCYLKAGMHIRFHISFSYSRLFERCYSSTLAFGRTPFPCAYWKPLYEEEWRMPQMAHGKKHKFNQINLVKHI